jgi:predicted Rossmann fold flavoprotein
LNNFDILIIGGGAAGFFAAINCAEHYPDKTICILERGKSGLQKVKISGGGRCNVTHAEFNPTELVTNYPRGDKELLGPFHRFMTGDTVAWFEKRGVGLKTEDDGRMFPVTDSSQTIIDCFLNEAEKSGVVVKYNCTVTNISQDNEGFTVATKAQFYQCEKLIIATGSSPKMWRLLEELGHTIIKPVPSLFTFNIHDDRINGIPGVVANNVSIEVLNSTLKSEGPLLITHVGISAPAVLKLSAYGAIELAERQHRFKIRINFINETKGYCLELFQKQRTAGAKKTIMNSNPFDLPKRLWKQLVVVSEIPKDQRWAELTKTQASALAEQLTAAVFQVSGKSTFKEEFVTAGGVDLKEIDFKTFGSKLVPNLYFAGEVINVDAVTGGFNFQNAWTGAYIVSQSLF